MNENPALFEGKNTIGSKKQCSIADVYPLLSTTIGGSEIVSLLKAKGCSSFPSVDQVNALLKVYKELHETVLLVELKATDEYKAVSESFKGKIEKPKKTLLSSPEVA